MPPAVAATLGTWAELGLPVLLLAGFGTRFAAVAMFVFNIVAAISDPDLSAAGLKDHVLWGALLLVLLFYGPSKFSLDHLFGRRLGVKD
jgi:putative oxidoreductase